MKSAKGDLIAQKTSEALLRERISEANRHQITELEKELSQMFPEGPCPAVLAQPGPTLQSSCQPHEQGHEKKTDCQVQLPTVQKGQLQMYTRFQ